jgi:putative transposase
MKRSRFSEEQIIGILREQEAGAATADVCRKHGISSATFYKWKGKFGGMAGRSRSRPSRSRRQNEGLKQSASKVGNARTQSRSNHFGIFASKNNRSERTSTSRRRPTVVVRSCPALISS